MSNTKLFTSAASMLSSTNSNSCLTIDDIRGRYTEFDNFVIDNLGKDERDVIAERATKKELASALINSDKQISDIQHENDVLKARNEVLEQRNESLMDINSELMTGQSSGKSNGFNSLMKNMLTEFSALMNPDENGSCNVKDNATGEYESVTQKGLMARIYNKMQSVLDLMSDNESKDKSATNVNKARTLPSGVEDIIAKENSSYSDYDYGD